MNDGAYACDGWMVGAECMTLAACTCEAAWAACIAEGGTCTCLNCGRGAKEFR